MVLPGLIVALTKQNKNRFKSLKQIEGEEKDAEWDKALEEYEEHYGRCYYCGLPFLDCTCGTDFIHT